MRMEEVQLLQEEVMQPVLQLHYQEQFLEIVPPQMDILLHIMGMGELLVQAVKLQQIPPLILLQDG